MRTFLIWCFFKSLICVFSSPRSSGPQILFDPVFTVCKTQSPSVNFSTGIQRSRAAFSIFLMK